MEAALKRSTNEIRGRRIKTATKDPALVREKREVLISAAIGVLLEKGFHNTTVRDIGRAAGMTQGTIYNYVSSKDDILYMVCDRIVDEYQSKALQAVQTSSDPTARVRSAIRAVCEVMHAHRREIALIYQDSHLLDRKSLRVIKARVEEFIGLFERIALEAAHELGRPLPHPHVSANILTFLPVMISLRRWSLGRDLPPERLVEEVTEFMVRGLGFD
ncbi:MAG: TetR/AcrR family transcriptional regulator [Lautropia sp.]